MSDLSPENTSKPAGSNYYEVQAAARGIHGTSDVEKLAKDSARIYEKVLKPWLPEHRGAGIYEVACGPGILQAWLKSEGYTDVWGSDFSIKEAKVAKMINCRIECGDSVEGVLTRGPEKYDVIVALDFIEHIPKDLVIPFLERAFEALRPGGVLIMRAPNADSPVVGLNIYNDITHVWAYTTVAMRAMSRIVGYSSIEFMDDTLSSIHRHRWIKYPVMWGAQFLLKKLINIACRVGCHYLGSSIYSYARK